jgi:hypothetical protein
VTPPRRPAPPPLEANDQQVAGVLTAVWAVALVIVLILRDRLPAGGQWWIWTCVAGVSMGLFGLWYVPRMKRMRARKAQRRAEARAAEQAPGAGHATGAGQAPGAGQGGQPWSSDSKTVSSTETPG